MKQAVPIYCDKKGVVLAIVVSMVLVVSILIGVALRIASNQSRLIHHQVSRIQAYYASMAGINYAFEKLRRGNDPACWPASGNFTRRLLRSGAGACDITDPDLPASILRVDILVGSPGAGIDGTTPISATAIYTFTP